MLKLTTAPGRFTLSVEGPDLQVSSENFTYIYIYINWNVVADELDILSEFLDFIYVALCSKWINKKYK